MLSPIFLRWLHRIGYATTLIVVAEIASIGWFTGKAWIRDREIAAAQRDDTRTHAGPLSAQRNDIVREDASKLLAELPSLKALGGDAARFVAMPSFGSQWYSVAVRADGQSARGVLVTMQHSGTDDLGPPKTQTFSMPLSAYKTLIAQTFRLADGWAGEPDFWTDGTPFAFEVVHRSSVVSGIGNSPTHYGQIASIVRNGLAPYVSAVARLDDDWMDRNASDQR